MRADRRAEWACYRSPSAWLTLILAGLVVLSTPFVTASLQRATGPPPVPSSPHRVLATNATFLRGLTGSFTEKRGQVRDGDVRYTFAAGGLRVGMVASGLLIGVLDHGARISAASSRSPSDSVREDGGDATTVGASVVRIAFEGSNRVAPRARGELPARSNYFAGSDPTKWRVGLQCGSWDRTQALTIDPLLYSTFLGGSTDARGLALAVDASGNVYVTGYTLSADLPTTPGAYRTSIGGAGTWDAFVVKLNPSGTAPVYSTFLGGSNHDRGFAIAIDAAGDAYVAGYTNSSDFPTTPGALRTSFASGGVGGIVTKLKPPRDGPLYSTFLGGTADDRIYAIALDANGEAFVTGRTKSPDFPITAGAVDPTFQNTICGALLFAPRLLSKLHADRGAMA